jgi:ATP-dependent 26S proteasome regulatory subunit
MFATESKLNSAQQRAFASLMDGISLGEIATLRGDPGMGKSVITTVVVEKTGAALVAASNFMQQLSSGHPVAVEEAFLAAVAAALSSHKIVVVDDLHLVKGISDHYGYPRGDIFDVALAALAARAHAGRHKLVFTHVGTAPDPLRQRAFHTEIKEFTEEDYRSICGAYLCNEILERLDFSKIHRFAPKLNGHQLKNACLWTRRNSATDTDVFVDHLASQNLTSNVEIAEVAPVSLSDLKGVDDVIQALETKIALPFENAALALELRLKPKRGVLLAGPPGTGKTTIGRALAHRLKSKFFLIDGTVIAGSGDFYEEVEKVFKIAKENAPSVIFIDDADVIFEEKRERGFYRYLLTMLDGLESASAERVCVMMTAMDASSLPEAMLRSGRVELWLETRLPDESARESIIRDRLSGLPDPIGTADAEVVAAASSGLTGADLKAVIEDGKLLFAHDYSKGETLRPPEEYFLDAIQTVRFNRRNYGKRKSSPWEQIRFGFKIE